MSVRPGPPVVANTSSPQYANLTNWWPLDQASGTTRPDIIGGVNAPSTNGGVTFDGYLTDPSMTYCYSSQRLGPDTPNLTNITTPLVQPNQAFSCTFLFSQIDHHLASQTIMDWQAPDGSEVFIGVNNTNAIEVLLKDGAGKEIDRSTNVLSVDSVWHLCQVTYDGSNTLAGLQIHVDGVDAINTGDDFFSGPLSAITWTTNNFWLAYKDSFGDVQGARIADIRFYSVKLSPSVLAAQVLGTATEWDLYPAPQRPTPGLPPASWFEGRAVELMKMRGLEEMAQRSSVDREAVRLKLEQDKAKELEIINAKAARDRRERQEEAMILKALERTL